MPTPQPATPPGAAQPGQLAAVRELNLRYFDPDFSDEQRSVVDELNRRTGHPSRSPGDVISRIAARRTAAPQDFGPPQPSAGAGEMASAGLRGVGKGLLALIPGVTGKPSGPPTGTPSDTLLRSDDNAAAYGVTDDPFTWVAAGIGGVMDRTAALDRNQPDTPAQALVRSAGTLVPQIEDVAAPGMAFGAEDRAPTRDENLRAAEGGGSLAAVAALPIALKRIPAALRKVTSTTAAPAEAATAPRADAINRVIGDGSYINRRNIDVGRAFADAGVEIDLREIRRNPRALVDYTDRVIDRENLAADQLLQSEAAQAPAANGHVIARGPRTIALLNSADIEAARAVDDYVTRRVDELSARHGGNGAISVADADLLKRELQNRANYDKIFGNTALTTSDNLRNQLLADTAQRFDRLGDTIPGYRELNNRRSSLIHWRDNLLDPIVDTAKTGSKRPSRVVAGARTAVAAVRGDVHGIVRGASDLAAAQGKLPTPERVARAIRSAVKGREASGPTAEILRTAAPRAQSTPPQPSPTNPDFAAGEFGPAYSTGGRVGQTAASFPPTGPTEIATELGPPDAASAHRARALDRTGEFRDAGIASNAAVLQRGPSRPLLEPPSGPTVQPSSGITFEADAPGGQRGITPRSPGGQRDVVARSTRPLDNIAPPPPAPHGTDLPREVFSGEQPVAFEHPTDGKVAGTVARHFVRADGKRALIVQTPKGERMVTTDAVQLPKVRAGSASAAPTPPSAPELPTRQHPPLLVERPGTAAADHIMRAGPLTIDEASRALGVARSAITPYPASGTPVAFVVQSGDAHYAVPNTHKPGRFPDTWFNRTDFGVNDEISSVRVLPQVRPTGAGQFELVAPGEFSAQTPESQRRPFHHGQVEWPKADPAIRDSDINTHDENDALFVRRRTGKGVPLPSAQIIAMPSAVMPKHFKNARAIAWASPIHGTIEGAPGAFGVFGREIGTKEREAQKTDPRRATSAGIRATNSNTVELSRLAGDDPATAVHEANHAVWQKDLSEEQRQGFRDLAMRHIAAASQARGTPQFEALAAKIPQAVKAYFAEFRNDREHAFDESFAELGAQYILNPSAFKATYPEWYGYIKQLYGVEYIRKKK